MNFDPNHFSSQQPPAQPIDPWAALLDDEEDEQQSESPIELQPQRLIAVTGGIGSGKSLLGDYLVAKNIPVIDADAVVHQLLREDVTIQENIRQAFGNDVFDEETKLPSRPKLAKVVFQNEEQRRLLESWLHPAVRAEMLAFRERHASAPIVVDIIPLLFESSLEGNYPEVWLIAATEADQSARLQQYRHMSAGDAEARLKTQMSLTEKHRRLIVHPNGHILLNTGTPADLYEQIDELLAPL